MTAVAGTAFSAADFNTHVRDNLLETAPAKATTAGRLMVVDGTNSVTEREIRQVNVATGQGTTSTSFTDLTTVGPSVNVVTGANALVFLTAQMTNSGAGNSAWMSFEVSGASSIGASDARAVVITSHANGNPYRMTAVVMLNTLTPGTNTFQAKYRCGAGTATFSNRTIQVMAL